MVKSLEWYNTSAEFDEQKRNCTCIYSICLKNVLLFYPVCLLNTQTPWAGWKFYLFHWVYFRWSRTDLTWSTSCNLLFIIMLLLCLSLQSREWTCVDWAPISLASPRSSSGGSFPSPTLPWLITARWPSYKWNDGWRWALFKVTQPQCGIRYIHTYYKSQILVN